MKIGHERGRGQTSRVLYLSRPLTKRWLRANQSGAALANTDAAQPPVHTDLLRHPARDDLKSDRLFGRGALSYPATFPH